MPQDLVQAHKWFSMSETNGVKGARENREFAEKQMTSSQIEEAQKLARDWMEKHAEE